MLRKELSQISQHLFVHSLTGHAGGTQLLRLRTLWLRFEKTLNLTESSLKITSQTGGTCNGGPTSAPLRDAVTLMRPQICAFPLVKKLTRSFLSLSKQVDISARKHARDHCNTRTLISLTQSERHSDSPRFSLLHEVLYLLNLQTVEYLIYMSYRFKFY